MSKVEENMPAEYQRSDLGGKGQRGRYYQSYQEGVVLSVQLESDVAKVFPDSESVNQALRTMIRLMSSQKQGKPSSQEAA